MQVYCYAACITYCCGWLQRPEGQDEGAHLDIEDVGWHVGGGGGRKEARKMTKKEGK